MMPFAAASIGQVHKASLPDGRQVAVKVQFPGVAESIDADISTLKGLLALSAVLPKGLYLENTLRVMRRELKDECDYVREAECARRFKALLQADSNIAVPKVIDHLCTAKVLTAEMMQGRPLSKSAHLNQSTKDHVS
jgi:aarF domain-containing kinase